MKKIFLISSMAVLLGSCASYTEDQEKAASEFCECMDKDTYGDFDINFFECNNEINTNYSGETFADEGWSLALDEKCPDVAGKIVDAD